MAAKNSSGSKMKPNNIRYQKIRNLVLDCIAKKDGVDRAVELLNKNGFTAPCGRKAHWKPEQVRQIVLGEICDPYTVSMSVLVQKSIHQKLKKTGSISDFIRAAINEKIRRDDL